MMKSEPSGGGALAQNIVHFRRALREAGVPLGPGAVLDAIAAIEAAGLAIADDFYATLHAVFVKKHEHSLLFDQAFEIFWKHKGLLETDRDVFPEAPSHPSPSARKLAQAGSRTLCLSQRPEAQDRPVARSDARFTMSGEEILRTERLRPDERGRKSMTRASL